MTNQSGRNNKNNYPGWCADKRNEERMKGVIRSFLEEIRDEYRYQAARLIADGVNNGHPWVIAQYDHLITGMKVLDDIIINRLQPDKKHAPKAAEKDKDVTDAALRSDSSGDSTSAS